MPGRRKRKPFIDKKNATTFHLVHRSQKDPLQADEDAPKRVLLEAGDVQPSKKQRKEEERKFGVFFDDDYNYLQHLREAGEVSVFAEGTAAAGKSPQSMTSNSAAADTGSASDSPCGSAAEVAGEDSSIRLPSSLFESATELRTGLLNKAATIRGPRPDWDPDIVAALDGGQSDDVDELEDDFVQLANMRTSPVNLGDDDGTWSTTDDDSGDDDWSTTDSHGDGESGDEARCRFTNYSMSSSVLTRSEGLALLDDRFEKIYEEYDDEKIGGLDSDDEEGGEGRQKELLDEVLRDFETMKASNQQKIRTERRTDRTDCASSSSSDSDENLERICVWEQSGGGEAAWDCESILSTYSNLYNHPTVIKLPPRATQKPIRVGEKSGMPEDVMRRKKLTRAEMSALELTHKNGGGGGTRGARTSHVRKGESSEEKRQRKQDVRERRRDRRAEKKANKIAFKQEEMRQQKESQNLKNTAFVSAV